MIRSRVFIVADKLFNTLLRGLKAIHQGLWLGIMGHGEFRQLSDQQYGRWPRYRSDEHNLSGLFDWEEKAIKRHFSHCDRLLIGAAGGGREVIGLAGMGFAVIGFECQSELVKIANELLIRRGIEANVVQANEDAVPRGLGEVDGLVLGWGAYIHISGHENRIKFLREFREYLPPGGPLLLSFFVRKPGSRFFTWIYNIARTVRLMRFSPETVDLGDSLEGTFDHYFDKTEVESELQKAGFQLVEYSEEPFGHAVAKKL